MTPKPTPATVHSSIGHSAGPTPLGPRLSPRAHAKILSLKIPGASPTVTERLRWLDARIRAEKAPPLKPGSLAHLETQAATIRTVLAPEDAATVRSYSGEASAALGGRIAFFSDAAEYMYERLMKNRKKHRGKGA